MSNINIFQKIYFFLLTTLICSCSTPNSYISSANNQTGERNSIDINFLLSQLEKADKNITPKLIYDEFGIETFTYSKGILGELKFEEVKERFLSGSNFYKNDRQNIRKLLKKINDLKINTQIIKIDNSALGQWIPKRKLILLNQRNISAGSRFFLNTLRHEVIHLAQSCFNDSITSYPKRIGLPLEFSKKINMNLNHELYKSNPDELIFLEREAFTYSKVDGAAYKLLNRFCF